MLLHVMSDILKKSDMFQMVAGMTTKAE